MTDDPRSNSFIEDMRDEGGGMGIEQTREGSSRDGWRDPSKPTQEGKKKKKSGCRNDSPPAHEIPKRTWQEKDTTEGRRFSRSRCTVHYPTQVKPLPITIYSYSSPHSLTKALSFIYYSLLTGRLQSCELFFFFFFCWVVLILRTWWAMGGGDQGWRLL